VEESSLETLLHCHSKDVKQSHGKTILHKPAHPPRTQALVTAPQKLHWVNAFPSEAEGVSLGN